MQIVLNFPSNGLAWGAGVVTALLSTVCGIAPAEAGTFMLDFEGLLDLELVQDFYDHGQGSEGSLYGVDLGVSFSDNAIVLTDLDDGGSIGDFGGEPSPDNVIFFDSGESIKLNVAPGFSEGFSLFYAAVPPPGEGPQLRGKVKLFDGFNGTGTLLGELDLPSTPSGGAPDPQGEFSPFVPEGLEFSGTAYSVVLEGTALTIGYDNLTFGSATPLDGFFDSLAWQEEYGQLKPKAVPETSPLFGLLGLGLGVGLWRRQMG